MKNLTIVTARKLDTKSLNKLAANAGKLKGNSLNAVHTVLVERKQEEFPNAEIIKILSSQAIHLQTKYKGFKLLIFNDLTEAHFMVEDELEAIEAMEGKEVKKIVKVLEKKSVKKVKKAKEAIKEITKTAKELDETPIKPLEKLTNKELRQILDDADVKVAKKAKKGELITLILAHKNFKETKSTAIKEEKEIKKPKTSKKKSKVGKTLDDLGEIAKDLGIKLDKKADPKGAGVEVSFVPHDSKKYKKTGKRSLEWEFEGTLVERGDTVCFVLKGEAVEGEFRHVNQNMHSPKGYAVIKVGKKLYERTINKVTVSVESDEEE